MKKPRSRGPRQNTQVAKVDTGAVSTDDTLAEDGAHSALPEEARDRMNALVLAEEFRGRLPSPDMFQHYEKVLSGSADRIMTMAEKEQAHRITWERRELEVESRIAFTGLIFGFTALLFLIGLAGYCAYIGNSTIAGLALGAATLGVVSKFVTHRWSQQEQEPKRKPANR